MSRPASLVRTALSLALVLLATAVPAAAGRTTGDHDGRRVSVPGRLSVRVPAGWYVLRGWLSDVVDPAPRLAVASFPAKLSRHTCECGSPNVVRFPRGGAFIFMWEYLETSRRGLARTPRRPAHFHLTDARRAAVRRTCTGPSDSFGFKDSGRVFQLDVYLGPRATPSLRRRLTAMLDSLRAGAAARTRPEQQFASPFAISSFSYRRAWLGGTSEGAA